MKRIRKTKSQPFSLITNVDQIRQNAGCKQCLQRLSLAFSNFNKNLSQSIKLVVNACKTDAADADKYNEPICVIVHAPNVLHV